VPHARIDMFELGRIGRRVIVIHRDAEIGGGLTPAAHLRTVGRRGPARFLAQREPVDLVRIRQVGIFRHPGAQLRIAAAIARMHIALIEHIAHEALVGELVDQPVGLLPARALLLGKNLDVKLAILAAENFRAPDLGAARKRRGDRRGNGARR